MRTVLDGETQNHAHQEDPIQSRKYMAKKLKGYIGNEDPIILTHFEIIFDPENKAAMTTEEQNAAI